MPDTPLNLVVFGEDWGGLPSSTQHLIRNMPDRGKVLWFNSIGLRAPTITFSDAKRALGKIKARLGNSAGGTTAFSSAPPPDGMEVMEPKVLPLHQFKSIQAWNVTSLTRQAEDFIASCGENPPVIWVTVPTAASFVAAHPELRSIYYCCDDFGTLPGVDHATALAAEASLARDADLIVVTNELLADKFPKEKTVYVPQGVDIDLFATPCASAAEMPQGKVAGFFGLIAEWVDQDLIAGAARALAAEGWTFLIIGNGNVDTTRLEAEPNIQLLGPRPYDQLPSFAQHWEVSLLPFADTPEVRASNPLKLREYLAAGPTVVSTPFPAAAPYARQLSIAGTLEDFITAIRAHDNSDAAIADRRQSIAAESWTARGEEILAALSARRKA